MKAPSSIVRLCCLFLCASASAGVRDVILTTDCGTEVDDQWAIVYLFTSPEFRVRGVVTTHAPNLADPKTETSSECVRDVLSRLKIPDDARVFAGSNTALNEHKPLLNAGVDFILRTSRAYSSDHRLIILTIGATTDVASALLHDPTIEDRIAIVTMGFNSWPEGTDPWNIKNDPLAYAIILDSKAPLTIGGADVCRAQLTLHSKQVADLLKGSGEVGRWLTEDFQDFVTRNAEFVSQDVGPEKWVIWDMVVIAYLLGLTDFDTYPRPGLAIDSLRFQPRKTDETIKWVTAVDGERVWFDFVTKIGLHNQR